ncbi:4-(cytidine 5'-diphospho)-2-C-methyl-D-erythritol kinase [Thermopolyspora sp. NPDC052614]|uniref:4-(cytidine 5'-diphospho)-2-C-methyl-D-erythritol kinase n=1 Tax=Thermopolyspora sp. NPDC052614 TaxID=3155682 RepID=UPI00343B216E
MEHPRYITVEVPAKINLQLAVGPVREDGYHEVVTVYLAVSIVDRVRASTADAVTVEVVGPQADRVPADGSNLAVRAARLLAERAGVSYGARLWIDKRIPVAGGMAGGSADAAAALIACNHLWDLGLGKDELVEIGAELGSDVPFSLLGGAAVGTGRGERLRPLDAERVFTWVLVPADGGLATPAVYAECDRIREETGVVPAPPRADEDLIAALAKGDAHALGRALANDLEPAALRLNPSLARTLATGRELGALGGLVSGSGPTCVFLAEDSHHGAALSEAFTAAGHPAIHARGPVHGPVVIDDGRYPGDDRWFGSMALADSLGER